MVLVLTFLSVSFAEQPALDGVPGDLEWRTAPSSWHLEHGSELNFQYNRPIFTAAEQVRRDMHGSLTGWVCVLFGTTPPEPRPHPK